VDWEGGAAAFLYDLARRSGDEDPGPGHELCKTWEQIQFEFLQEHDYLPYSEVLSRSLRTWVGERGYRWNERDGQAFEHAMQCWQPFPDTIPALQRTQKAGVKLVIISNTDRGIMEHTLRHLAPLEFDEVVVAEDARAYKPDLAPFTRALDEIRVSDPSSVLHVAFGFKYDIAPAQSVGMRTAWVNRHQEQAPGDERPDYEWRDLWGLAELAEGQNSQ
jgi:2-haloacid dehalogenase